jgi:hypothetical protein
MLLWLAIRILLFVCDVKRIYISDCEGLMFALLFQLLALVIVTGLICMVAPNQ